MIISNVIMADEGKGKSQTSWIVLFCCKAFVISWMYSLVFKILRNEDWLNAFTDKRKIPRVKIETHDICVIEWM